MTLPLLSWSDFFMSVVGFADCWVALRTTTSMVSRSFIYLACGLFHSREQKYFPAATKSYWLNIGTIIRKTDISAIAVAATAVSSAAAFS